MRTVNMSSAVSAPGHDLNPSIPRTINYQIVMAVILMGRCAGCIRVQVPLVLQGWMAGGSCRGAPERESPSNVCVVIEN